MFKYKIIVFILFTLVFCVACQMKKIEDETQIQEDSSSTREKTELIDNENNNLLTLEIEEYQPTDTERSFFESNEAEDIRIFNEIFDEAFKLEGFLPFKCIISHVLHSGDKSIEVYYCENREKELFTDVYLSGEADLNNPTRRIPKDDPLNTKLWNLIEKLEQTDNLLEQTENIK